MGITERIETTIDIDATPTQVWDVLTDFAAHEQWNPFFASIAGAPVEGTTIKVRSRKDDGSDGFGFSATILDVVPGEVLRWRGTLIIRGIFDGTHEFVFEPLADGRTRMIHAEEFKGVLVPLVGKLLRDTHDSFDKLNVAFAERVAELHPRRDSATCS